MVQIAFHPIAILLLAISLRQTATSGRAVSIPAADCGTVSGSRHTSADAIGAGAEAGKETGIGMCIVAKILKMQTANATMKLGMEKSRKTKRGHTNAAIAMQTEMGTADGTKTESERIVIITTETKNSDTQMGRSGAATTGSTRAVVKGAVNDDFI